MGNYRIKNSCLNYSICINKRCNFKVPLSPKMHHLKKKKQLKCLIISQGICCLFTGHCCLAACLTHLHYEPDSHTSQLSKCTSSIVPAPMQQAAIADPSSPRRQERKKCPAVLKRLINHTTCSICHIQISDAVTGLQLSSTSSESTDITPASPCPAACTRPPCPQQEAAQVQPWYSRALGRTLRAAQRLIPAMQTVLQPQQHHCRSTTCPVLGKPGLGAHTARMVPL